MKKKYVSLAYVSQETGLPQKYLKTLTENKKIPALYVNSRWRFNFEAVQQSLDRLAENWSGNE